MAIGEAGPGPVRHGSRPQRLGETVRGRLGRDCAYAPSRRFGLHAALRHWCPPGGRVLRPPVDDDVIRIVTGYLCDPPLDDYAGQAFTDPAPGAARWFARHALPADPLRAREAADALERSGARPAGLPRDPARPGTTARGLGPSRD
ncbi:hypothetical protein [Streptomyces sp. NPDC016626]|uniref:hypothetical protein n=1 Tax=Streptomyces sp. NPDC016626 TaxID=3364968 RepID=UPI0036FCC04F